MKKFILLTLISFGLVACTGSLKSAVKNGVITPSFNDTLLTDDYLWVRGFGAANPQHPTQTQRKILSREAAIANAYQRLSEILYGTNLESNVEIVDAVSSNSTINATSAGLIQQMELVSTEYLNDDGCTVIMRIHRKYIDGSKK